MLEERCIFRFDSSLYLSTCRWILTLHISIMLCYFIYCSPLFFCNVIFKFAALCKSSGMLKETVLL